MRTLPSPLVTFSPTTTIATTTTMAKRLRKPTLKVSENSALYATDDTIILGLEDPIVEPNQALGTPILNPSSTPPASSIDDQPCPLRPLTETTATVIPTVLDTTEVDTASQADAKEERVVWSEEMVEQLVETLQEVFEEGGAADNSFKKVTFEQAAINVNRLYRGLVRVSHQQCKNKWQDLKSKWAYWKLLAGMSGFGWNEDVELYTAFDYVWNNLNNAHPGIIWHKAHVMPYREALSLILHDVQANGKGAMTIEEPTPIDPRLTSLQGLASSSQASSTPLRGSPAPAKPPYNRSRKRGALEASNEEDLLTSGNASKKIDLGVAITGLTRELALGRQAQENFQSNQQKAIKLLSREYKARLAPEALMKAMVAFKDDGNAVTFLLMDSDIRDMWLEIETNSTLI
jgi:hypothetical protein